IIASRVTRGRSMRAAFYTEQGPARGVLKIGEQPTPEPRPGEVRVRLRTSGVNPSDWKSRRGGFGRGMVAPLVIPHSDGAGDIDAVGEGVPASRIGERVWIWNGQWKRAFGTAAQYIALPSAQAVALPRNTDYAAGACLGIPALTALQAVLRRHGVAVVYGTGAAEASIPASWLMLNGATLRLFLIYDISAADRAAVLDELDTLLAQGRLVHAVGQRFPLEAIAEAHEAVERGAVIGNVVLDIA